MLTVSSGVRCSSELTWNACANGDKRDGSDRVFEANCAAEARRDVTNDTGQHANHYNGHSEAGPATNVVYKVRHGKHTRERGNLST